MMEGLLTQRVTPLLKCMVLFLFIFTAKVLTSRPHEAQDLRNSIHHQKPAHYVRTFTKYHHRRTIQWNNQDATYWPLTQDQPKTIAKRSVDVLNSNDVYNADDDPNYNQLASESVRVNIITDKTSTNPGKDQNGLSTEVKKVKVKPAVVVTEKPTASSATITCLYKLESVSMSVTPVSYVDDTNEQLVVDSVIYGMFYFYSS